MTSESRRCAEAVHKIMLDDLRFADAKALFVVGVVGAWAKIVADSTITDAAAPFPLRMTLVIFFIFVFGSLCCALWAIRPVWPKPSSEGAEDIHQATFLKKFWARFNDAGERQRTLAEAFEQKSGAPGSTYDGSLLADLLRIGNRSVQKYQWVRGAIRFGYASFVCSVIAIVLKMFPGLPTLMEAFVHRMACP